MDRNTTPERTEWNPIPAESFLPPNKEIVCEKIPEYEAISHENSATPGAPDDFDSFDFTLLEDKARNLWFADDNWVNSPNLPIKETYGEDTLSNRQRAIQTWVSDAQKIISETNATYVLNWMDNQSPETDWGSLFRTALRTLVTDGPTEYSIPTQIDLEANAGPQLGEAPASVIWGRF